jgi:hypothetical protein
LNDFAKGKGHDISVVPKRFFDKPIGFLLLPVEHSSARGSFLWLLSFSKESNRLRRKFSGLHLLSCRRMRSIGEVFFAYFLFQEKVGRKKVG